MKISLDEPLDDPQGIPWNTDAMPVTRSYLRDRRLFSYRSFRNCTDEIEAYDYLQTHDSEFFKPVDNHTGLAVSCEHFQLRNCICTTAKDKIYSICTTSGKIMRYNPYSREAVPAMSIRKSARLVSMHVSEPYIAAGGINGELFIVDQTQGALLVDEVLAEGDNCITNHCSFYKDHGKLKLLVCNNDHSIRLVDPDYYAATKIYKCAAPVNHATISPDFSLVASAQDDRDAYVYSYDDGSLVFKLQGHQDFSFATGWHPLNSHILATGNQDLSVKLWDLRNGGKAPLATLSAKLGSCLSLKFTGNGEYLVYSESADFVHIVDATLFEEEQVIDLFGEIAGFTFDDEVNPERIYIGIYDSTYRSLVEFKRNRKGSVLGEVWV